MTKGTHLLRSALLALLALAVISGGSLAAGDLFDDDYSDCPHRTRLRDGQISDLSVNRDSDDEDHVNVSWAATDPATWGLGANAYSTSLVVILDDDDKVQTKTMSLGSRKTTFEDVDTGVEVTVQMAIVVDTADGDYLISDILAKNINQSLTEPAFMTDVVTVTVAQRTANPDATPAITAVAEDSLSLGTFYYVGYNENFGNYKANTYSFRTNPATARLRIGLAHGGENDDARDDVEFDAYIVRITDESDDVVPEGDDIATVESDYGTNRLSFGAFNAAAGTLTSTEVSNVRVNDGGTIRTSVQDNGPEPAGTGTDDAALTYTAFTSITEASGATGLSYIAPAVFTVGPAEAADVATATATGTGAVGQIYALPPDEHRDFPIDVFSSDETYKITAWAINDDDEVISPVATLKVRPIDEAQSLTVGTALDDYLGAPANTAPVAGSNSIYVTEFTVLK